MPNFGEVIKSPVKLIKNVGYNDNDNYFSSVSKDMGFYFINK